MAEYGRRGAERWSKVEDIFSVVNVADVLVSRDAYLDDDI